MVPPLRLVPFPCLEGPPPCNYQSWSFFRAIVALQVPPPKEGTFKDSQAMRLSPSCEASCAWAKPKKMRGYPRAYMGHAPSTAGTFRKQFRKISGKTPETLSERFLELPWRVQLGSPKPDNSRHLRLAEHFQNSHPPPRRLGAPLFRNSQQY